MAESSCYSWEGADLLLQVRVQPRAGRDELAEMRDGYWRVRITAPPVEGKANACLCKFLAAVFQVPSSRVILVSGAASRNKHLRIRAPRRLPPAIKPPARTAELPEK